MKITVLFLGKQGGGCVYTYEMIKSLANKGCSLQIILSNEIENKDEFEDLFSNTNVETIWVSTYKSNKINFLLKSLNVFQFISLSNQIKKFSPDWIYLPMISLWAAFIVPFLGSRHKIISTIHDVKPHLGEENLFIRVLNNYVINKSKKIITLTESFIPLISEIYSVEKENICWIRHGNYNYYRPNDFKNKRTVSGTILFFGRIHEYKGISVLLSAMELICNENNAIKLKIVGNGELSEDNQKQIMNLSNRVEVVNRWIRDEEIYVFFNDVDLVVAPYIEASQSGVVMLAYAFGKPVIVTDVGGLPEQVYPDSGIVVPTNDIYKLSETILELYSTPQKLIQMGDRAYQRSISDFAWNISADTLIDFIST